MAYGYRDDAYFFLKIRNAFPEFPGEPFCLPHLDIFRPLFILAGVS